MPRNLRVWEIHSEEKGKPSCSFVGLCDFTLIFEDTILLSESQQTVGLGIRQGQAQQGLVRSQPQSGERENGLGQEAAVK